MRSVIAAAFLFGLAQPVAAQSPDVKKAYLTVLNDLAKLRVEHQNCLGGELSALRDLTENTIDLARIFKIMPPGEATDIINDGQILERNRTGYRCENQGAALAAFEKSHAEFERLVKR